MRFVIYGAGAVGGVIGGRLVQYGQDVVLIGRANQYAAIRECGLRIESPGGTTTVDVRIVEHPQHIRWTPDDVVLLTVKTQDTSAALDALYSVAPEAPVVCVQNGVENERIALRWFRQVYGICVMCPATYLTPGVVHAGASPTTGILDLGCYPSGVDERCTAIASALQTATFISQPRPDIMRWKYTKLLMNLSNSVGAICGPEARAGALPTMARQEGVACLEAAGIDYVTEKEDAERRGDIFKPAEGSPRGISGEALHGRASSVKPPALSRDTSMEKSRCWAAFMAYRLRSMICFNGSQLRWHGKGSLPGPCRWRR